MPSPVSSRSMSVKAGHSSEETFVCQGMGLFLPHTRTLPRYIVEEDYDGYSNHIWNYRIRHYRGPNRVRTRRPPNSTKPFEHTVPKWVFFVSALACTFCTLVLTFMARLLNVPNILCFSSEEYSQGQPGVTFLLKGSAICVPCPSCDHTKFDSSRFATTMVDQSMLGMTLSSALSSMLTQHRPYSVDQRDSPVCLCDETDKLTTHS